MRIPLKTAALRRAIPIAWHQVKLLQIGKIAGAIAISALNILWHGHGILRASPTPLRFGLVTAGCYVLTTVAEFPQHGRGGQGVIALQTTDRNGRMVGALRVASDDEIMLISSNGTLVRTPVSDISVQGRNTQGVRLIRLDDGDRLVGLERIVSEAGGEDDVTRDA